MSRILALDYGSKKTGIAVTDPLKIIANPLDTIATSELFRYLEIYCEKEEVESIVVGIPVDMLNQETHGTKGAENLVLKIKEAFPNVQVIKIDERFTSKMAFDTMVSSGISKKKRRNKELVDKLSATIILQSYLEQNS